MFLAKTGEKTAPAIGVKDGADIELTRADHEPLVGPWTKRAGTAQTDAVGHAAGLLTALKAFHTRSRGYGNTVIGELCPTFDKTARTIGHIGLNLQPREAAEHGGALHSGSLGGVIAIVPRTQGEGNRKMKNFFAGIICVILGGFMAWSMGPGIWNDLTVDKATLEPAPEYSVSEAECKTKAFIFGSCDLEFTHQQTGEEVKRDFMVFGNFGGESVYAMKSPDGYVTSNVGLDAVWNRMIMLAVMVTLLLGGGLLVLFKLVRGSS